MNARAVVHIDKLEARVKALELALAKCIDELDYEYSFYNVDKKAKYETDELLFSMRAILEGKDVVL